MRSDSSRCSSLSLARGPRYDAARRAGIVLAMGLTHVTPRIRSLSGKGRGYQAEFLVDTGASLVTLTREDARAAGIAPGELVYNHRASTANGAVRMAPVTLREIRIGQLSIYDVPAAVLEHLNISLLGMSFLTRLQGYEMREGKLTISW